MKQRLIDSLNRNTFLFLGGLAGVAHETLLTHAERPTLLILFAAMMGLPAFLSPIGKSLSDIQEKEHERRREQKEIEDKQGQHKQNVEDEQDEQDRKDAQDRKDFEQWKRDHSK